MSLWAWIHPSMSLWFYFLKIDFLATFNVLLILSWFSSQNVSEVINHKIWHFAEQRTPTVKSSTRTIAQNWQKKYPIISFYILDITIDHKYWHSTYMWPLRDVTVNNRSRNLLQFCKKCHLKNWKVLKHGSKCCLLSHI